MNKEVKKNPLPKKSIADDMEKLKQRRDDRKKKADEEKVSNVGNQVVYENGGIKCDAQFEKLMKKKKETVVNNPEQVI